MSFDSDQDMGFSTDPSEFPDNYPYSSSPSGGTTGRGPVLFIIIGALVLVGAIIPFVFLGGGGFTNSEVVDEAMIPVRANREVVQALGEPIEVKRMINGEYSIGDVSGEANMRMLIEGPNGQGTLHIDARKQNGEWIFYTLAVEVRDTGELIPVNEPVE